MTEKDPEQPERASLDVQTEVHFRLIERLAESEKQHRELLAELPDVVFRLDESGCVRFLNEAWSAQLGYEIDSTLGQDLTEFIHAGDREKWVGLVLPAGKTSEPDRDRVVRFIDKMLIYQMTCSGQENSSFSRMAQPRTLTTIDPLRCSTRALKYLHTC